jgi:hypothetical protein
MGNNGAGTAKPALRIKPEKKTKGSRGKPSPAKKRSPATRKGR